MLGAHCRAVVAGLIGLAAAILAGAASAAPLALDDLVAGKPSRTLSSYNLFKDAGQQIPNDGLVPYALATPLFSDYAEKFRFVHVPDGQRAAYDAREVFDFPVGSIFVKTFAFPADLREPDKDLRVLETRLLVREAKGWVAWPYVWDEDMSEARLKVIGKRIALSYTDHDGMPARLDYRVPNKNQCKGCHSVDGEISLIGPKARNLNYVYAYGAGPQNQLAHWTAAGLLTGAPDPADAPRVPVWGDPEDGTLDERARAYLDINCAHCHRAEGPASNSGLVLTYGETTPYARGFYKRPVAAGRGATDGHFVIEPGAPERSLLLQRMMSLEPGVAMPELARATLHAEGIALIRDYIAALPAEGP